MKNKIGTTGELNMHKEPISVRFTVEDDKLVRMIADRKRMDLSNLIRMATFYFFEKSEFLSNKEKKKYRLI